jgi:hypothetical protein
MMRRRDGSRIVRAVGLSLGDNNKGGAMSLEDNLSADDLDELGPIDYIVLEWPRKDRQPAGEVAPLIIDLVDRGLIRILDVAFMAKDEDGTVMALDASAMDADDFADFDGASTGLLSDEDLEDAAAVLEPGTSAAVLVWENRWAAPVAVALRKSGGQLVASGRIPIQAILADLEDAETSASS